MLPYTHHGYWLYVYLQSCCGKYHEGTLAPDAESLLRARFTAYKTANVEYIVGTTHRKNDEYTGDDRSYALEVKKTAKKNAVMSMNIISQEPGSHEDEHYITFTVKFRPRSPDAQGKPPEVTTERSHFVREDGKWMYYAMAE